MEQPSSNLQQPQMPVKSEGPKWLVLAVIIVGAVVAGFLWAVFAQKSAFPGDALSGNQTAPTALAPVVSSMPQGSAETDAKTAMLAQMSSSTEIADIEKDLRDTDLNGLDAEMTAIGSEVGQ